LLLLSPSIVIVRKGKMYFESFFSFKCCVPCSRCFFKSSSEVAKAKDTKTAAKTKKQSDTPKTSPGK
jgi:hypothetical protein